MREENTNETALLEQEALNSIPSGVGIFDLCGQVIRMVYLNDGFYRMIGAQRDERTRFFGEKTIQSVHPDDRAGLLAEALASIAEARLFDYRFRNLDAAGAYVWLGMRASHITLEEGTERFYAAYYNIDSYVSAQQKLAAEKSAAMEALKRRQIYSAAAAAGKLIVWEYDIPTRRIRMMRDSAYTREICDRLGIPESAENGPDLLSDILIPQDREAFREMYRRIDAGEPEASCEFRLMTEAGTSWWAVTCIAIREPEGGTTTVYGTGRDITQQRLEEERFRHEFQQLLAVNPEGLASFRHNITKNWTGDGQGVVSEGFLEAASGTVDRHVAALASVITNETDRAHFLADFRRESMLADFAAGKTQKLFECPMRMPDGRRIWVRGTMNMLRNPATGDIEGVSYAADVTEARKREEIARRVTEDEFDYVGVIYLKDRSFEFYSRNASIRFPALHQRVSYTECQDYVGENFIESGEREQDRSATDLDTIVAALRNSGRYETSYVRMRNGATSRLQLRYSWLDEESGEILAVRTDVTAAYEQEQAQLRRVKDALSEAERANAAKSDFLSRMSHDLRTPLNGILGLSGLAQDERLPRQAVSRYLDEIHRSGEYLLGIISDVLDMAKIESKRLELHPSFLSFDDFCTTLRDVIGVQCAEKHQSFEIVAPAGDYPPYILVDRTRFLQIFVNLLTNSVKFTPEGGHIRLRVEHVARSGRTVHKRFVVSDDGIGMSPAFAARAFEPFERELDVDSQAGTGLGLSIVKSIVGMMGGTVRMDSRPGRGTDVTVEMDLETSDLPEAEPETPPCTDALRGRRFLICEDNDINAEITATLLKNASALSDRAADGSEGLSLFSRAEPGFYSGILMDLRMPVMDGIAAAKAVRQLDRPDAKTIPIIAVTANAFDEDVAKSRAAGMNAHLSKPIDPKQMYGTLSRLLLTAD